MFDDYDYKKTDTRIKVRFVQRRDEPMYPWEIAGFLNKLNSVYYKYELLNSICSAVNQGISPSDIFVFNNSLPLYQRYADMNLLVESKAAKGFYVIGLPYPLFPNAKIYEFNLLYQAFNTVNVFLRKNHVRPLTTEAVESAYEFLKREGLDEAESHIVDLAVERAIRSAEHARKRNQIKAAIGEDKIVASLEKYRERKRQLLDDVFHINALGEEKLNKLIVSKGKSERRLSNVLLAFFRYFDKTSRPLVCARVDDGKFRVLGRSLVNKKEKTGLEVKEVSRNSPLGALIEGGAALYQAVQQEKRARELHELEMRRKMLEVQHAQERVYGEELRNLDLEIQIARKLNDIAENSDIKAVNEMQDSFVRQRLLSAYGVERRNAYSLLNRRGLELEEKSTRVIDVEV